MCNTQEKHPSTKKIGSIDFGNYYLDSHSIGIGIPSPVVSSVNGHFAGIDFPRVIQTFPHGLDDAGNVVGSYADSAGAFHGFVRDLGGTFTTLDAPGAGTALSQGSVAAVINDSGLIAGPYADSNTVYHAFVRDSSGNYTIFDAPSAGTFAGEGIFVVAINGIGKLPTPWQRKCRSGDR